MFSHYFNHPEPAGIFRFYNGYISLVPNLIGYLAVQIDPFSSPFLMGAGSLLLSVFSYCVFSLRRFRAVIVSDRYRIVLCIIMSLSALGNYALYSSVTFSQWHLLWIFLMVHIAPCKPLKGWEILLQSFLLCAAWSHPLSLIMLPIFVNRMFLSAKFYEKTIAILHSINLLFYLKFGMETVKKHAATEWSPAIAAVKSLVYRVIFESLAGSRVRHALAENGRDIIIYACVFAFFLVFTGMYLYSRGKIPVHGRRVLIMLLGLGAGMTFLNAFVRSASIAALFEHWSHRYFYVQQLLLLHSLGILLYYFVSSIPLKVYRRVCSLAVLLIIATIAVGKNVLDRNNFITEAASGATHIAFVHSLQTGRNLDQYYDEETDQFVLSRGGYWDIRIDRTAWIQRRSMENKPDRSTQESQAFKEANHTIRTDAFTSELAVIWKERVIRSIRNQKHQFR